MKKDDKEKSMEDCNKAIELDPKYIKAYIKRAELHIKNDNFEKAIMDY